MRLAVMQPYFFPYLGYFQLINAVDKFVIYDDVNYIKRGWINRNYFLLNGQPHRFTVPLKSQSSFVPIKETKIDQKLYPFWREKFIKTLKQTYSEAPNYHNTIGLVKDTLYSNTQTIADLAFKSIANVCHWLGLETFFSHSSENFNNQAMKGAERVIDICKTEKATQYINLPGGRNFYCKEDFNTHGIELCFLEPQLNEYPQGKQEFTKGLSIIDLMMFNSKESLKVLLNQYSLR